MFHSVWISGKGNGKMTILGLLIFPNFYDDVKMIYFFH